MNIGKGFINLKTFKMLSVVVPCYNEEKNIPDIVSKFDKILTESNENIEVILVNNGSSDNSKKVFDKKIRETKQNITVLNIKENIGYGHGILKGLKLAKGDILSWTHADLQTDPYDVVLAFKEHKKHKDSDLVIKGKRRNRNLIDSFFTLGMQVYCTIFLKTKLDDINAQPKLFSREFYEKSFKNPPLDFSLDLYLLLNAKRIKTVDVFFHKRRFGEAKGGGAFLGKWKLIKRTISYINKFLKDDN
jgi:glycosyltransferase involved in cell wall biosynthesis